jgi:hypothetical protein
MLFNITVSHDGTATSNASNAAQPLFVALVDYLDSDSFSCFTAVLFLFCYWIRMSSNKFVRRLSRHICALSLLSFTLLSSVAPVSAQAQTAPTKVVNSIEDLIPEMTKAGTVDAVLAMMRPRQ